MRVGDGRGTGLVEQLCLLRHNEFDPRHLVGAGRDRAVEHGGQCADVADFDRDLIVYLEADQARGAGLFRIVLRLQRQRGGLDIAVGDAALLDRRQHDGHLLGVRIAGRPRGLALAGDAETDHRGIGRGRNRRLAGDRHQLIELLGGRRRDGRQRRGGDHASG